MGSLYKTMLWTMAHLVPEKTFTAESLDILATDNMEILKEMAQDPNVIKAARTDSIYGLVNFMSDTKSHLSASPKKPVLLLYGLKDQVIPPEPIYKLSRHLSEQDTILYAEGYHMLLRDKQRIRVFKDIITWMDKHNGGR